MTEQVRFLIIGAGPTGLGAAYRLRELHEENFLVVEGSSQVGGLATSFRDSKGFTWDIGGHVQFSHYQYFDELMAKALGENGWNTINREAWIWMKERFLPYPLQNNLRLLPADDLENCIAGLKIAEQQAKIAPRNFRDWIEANFGRGLANLFMLPYNFKVWAYPAEELSYEWTGERVAVPAVGKILENITQKKDASSWGPNRTFQFPKSGGTGAVWERVADLVGREKIRLRNAVIEIRPSRKEAVLEDGTLIQYEHCLSTIPLDRLIAISHAAELENDAVRLKFSASNIVGIGLAGQPPQHLRKKSWVYFPEGNCPFYRVTIFSNYADDNVPNPGKQWSLMAEVSESSHKPVDQNCLLEDVLRGLRATNFIAESDQIISQWSYRAPYGYPTPFTERDSVLKKIHAYFEPQSISSRGRFGGWKYEVSNQDHSLMQGVEWVNLLLQNTPELTYPCPHRVNSGNHK